MKARGLALYLVISCCAAVAALAFGAVSALAAAPEAPQMEVQSHTATSAFLHGVLNPGTMAEPPQEGIYEFLYAASLTTCTGESKGAHGLVLGFAAQEVGEEIGGLSPHTTYTVCLRDRNLTGEETFSAPVTFTTSFEPEAPETGTVESISAGGATLTGTLNPNSKRDAPPPAEPGFYEFLYARGGGCEGEGSSGQIAAATGTEKEVVQAYPITGLAPGTQYTACLRAWNTTEQFATGAPITFTTLAEAPAVSGETAGDVASRSADVGAELSSGGLKVTFTVQYGTTGGYGQETGPVEVGAGTHTIGSSLTGLEPGTEYHYRFRVENSEGSRVGGDATFTTLAAPSGGTAQGGCPNEALRSELGESLLPDCRAYEMVTPPYKEGYAVSLIGHAITDKHAILVGLANLGASGSAESLSRGDIYLDTRGASGWSLSSLNAPSSEFVGEFMDAAEPVSGETLWEQHTPQESVSKLGLYARSAGTDPVFRRIGPLNIPYEGEPTEPSTASLLTGPNLVKPIASTNDYSHVVLFGKGRHWSIDPTPEGRPSVYEYSGTGNTEPILVGVEGERESHDLIGLCGTRFGSEGSAYNALSNDGEAIFFTVLPCHLKGPSSAEVYARLYGARSESGPALTVDVSASRCTESCGEVSGKNFEGASEDGRRVFFTSTQKLTDDAIDGTASGAATESEGCSNAQTCNLYEYRFDLTGGPARLAPGALHLLAGGGVRGVASIAEDGSRVYFVSDSEIASAGKNVFGKEPRQGQPNLYVYDTVTEKTAFIGTLAGGDGSDWTAEFTSKSAETGGDGGRYLLFESSGHLTPDDTGETRQLFEYDAETQELVRVSQGEDGYNEDGNNVRSGVPSLLFEGANRWLGGGKVFRSSANRLNMSADGRTVLFETGGRLSARAASAEAESPAEGPCRSLYEFHSDGPISEGSVRLVSDGHDTQLYNGELCGAQFESMDASGENVMFASPDSLVSGDVDGGQRDVYDARVGGGFAVPEQPSCSASGCEAAVGVPPVLAVPGSLSFAPVQVSGLKPKSKPRTANGSQGLARALRSCRKKRSRRSRRACERRARAHGRVGK